MVGVRWKTIRVSFNKCFINFIMSATKGGKRPIILSQTKGNPIKRNRNPSQRIHEFNKSIGIFNELLIGDQLSGVSPVQLHSMPAHNSMN